MSTRTPRGRDLSAALPELGRARAAATVLVAWLAVQLVGCAERTPEKPQARAARDTLDALAFHLEQRFVEATTDTTPELQGRERVRKAAWALVLGVVTRERPATGWTTIALEGALQERRLSAQAREITRGEEPWLVLLADPRRPETPEVVLLLYPKEAKARRLEVEPFLHPFQLAAWSDSLGHELLVAGVRRSPAGPQPSAWLFRYPDEPPEEEDPASLAPMGVWGLAAVGPGEISFRRPQAGGAPLVSVRRSALPNPLFDECISCPHLEADVLYRYDGTTLVPEQRTVRRTPYSAFVRFVEALVAQDETAAEGLAAERDVIETARSFAFDRAPVSGRWRIAPGISASSLDQIYLRGQEGAYRVLLARGDSGFVVTSISPTTFSLD